MFQFGDGYFVQYVAPATLAPIPRNVLFVLDVSDAMRGARLDHVKSAMSTALSDLRTADK